MNGQVNGRPGHTTTVQIDTGKMDDTTQTSTIIEI